MASGRSPRVEAIHQWDEVRAVALRFPEAFEDFPWGVPAVKVATGSKWPPVFVGLGRRDADRLGVYVKLTRSYDQAMALAQAVPTSNSGLGQWGRLTVPLPIDDLEVLFDWVDESYRNVASARLVTQLDARGPRSR